MSLHIVTDSTCDVSQHAAKEMGVTILPLQILIDGKTYLDGIDIRNDEFFKYLRTAKELPKTAQVSVETFQKTFDSFPHDDEVLVILISSLLSGTYQAALLAKSLSTHPNITIYDSMQATMGLGALVYAAVQFRDQGLNAATIITHLQEITPRMVLEAGFDDLRYLKMGGRIPGALTTILGTLNLKPIITMKNGKIHMASATIGMARAMLHMINRLKKTEVDFTLPAFIGHTDTPEQFEKFKQLVHKANPNFPVNNQMSVGATVGSHAGPGCVAIVYFEKKK